MNAEAVKVALDIVSAFATGALFGAYVVGFIYTGKLMLNAVRESHIPPSKHGLAALYLVFWTIFWPVTLHDIRELMKKK